MPALLIVDTAIHDPEEYEEYKAQVTPLVQKWGGTYLARGGRMQVLEDELWSPTRIVVLQFPTMEDAVGFTESDEYAPVRALRHAHARSTVVAVEVS